jgi:xanthine/uracil/vitamin C permease (AzgA family)
VQSRPLMTPWIALLLGLAIVAVLVMRDARPGLYIGLGATCLLAALISLYFGYAGANEDVGTSWSNEEPQRALRWAASFTAVGVTNLVAVGWAAFWRWRDRRRR